MMGLNEKLYLAVVKARTASIVTYLDQGAAINTRNKDLETTLIRAARLRNYVVQKILLSRGANPSLQEMNGLTALHHAASNGDVESIKLLLAHQAPIDALDVYGYSPLHYAVNRSHPEAVDILLFCGANVHVKAPSGSSPLGVASRDTGMKDVLLAAIPTLHGLQNKDVVIENKEIMEDRTYVFSKLNLTVRTNKIAGDHSVSLLCRRVRPEYSSPVLKPGKKQLLISDSFEFRLSHTLRSVEVIMDIPLFNPPDPFEEIIMKTDTCTDTASLPPLTDVRRVAGTQRWICRTRLAFDGFKSFILMTRPRVERVKIGPHSTHFRSVVDDFISVNVQPETFAIKSFLNTEVIPTPVYRHDDEVLSCVSSVANFFSIFVTSGEVPMKPVDVTMPEPLGDHAGDNDDCDKMVVLCTTASDEWFLADGSDDDADVDTSMTRLETWEVLSQDAAVYSGRVKVAVPHFSIHVPIKIKSDTDRKSMVVAADKLCQKACKREKFVVFFAAVKPLGNNTFTIAVECCETSKKSSRLKHWESQDFKCDQLETTLADFCSRPGTEYEISVVDKDSIDDEDVANMIAKVKKVSGTNTVPLHFHPNRHNFQTFNVGLMEKNGLNTCYIKVEQKKSGTDCELITELSLSLTGSPVDKMDTNESRDQFHDSGFKGFTNDRLLWQLATEMDAEWMKVGVNLGLAYKTVLRFADDSRQKNPEQRKFKMLRSWRDRSRYRPDSLGVPDLILAFKRTGRTDLVLVLKEKLQQWLEQSEDKSDRFCVWAQSSLSDIDLNKTEGTVEPLTDAFFLLLLERLGERDHSEMGPQLGLTPPDMQKIFTASLVEDRQHQHMNMLTTARDKYQSKFQFFQLLRAVVSRLEYPDVEKWMEEEAAQWLQKMDMKKAKMNRDFFFVELAESMELLESTDV